MSIATEITRLQNAKADLKTAINAKGGTIVDETLDAYAGFVDLLEIGGGGTPSTGSQNIFTGATIPLTYKDNTHTYENTYVYKSATHDITIAGLEGRATITGNGTKEVTVSFDVTSAVSSLKNFTITCTKDLQVLVYNGMHAHYGTTVTGILTFAYKNVTPDGSEGVIGTNYLFIETVSTDLPLFSSDATLWNTIYSYQLLNILMGNYSLTNIGDYFLNYCYSFNQPLTIPSGVTSTGNFFMQYCYAFNQPLDLSGVTSIGVAFMRYCYSFNQPLTIPSGVTSIGNHFMRDCYSFNQPLDLSGVTSIDTLFMNYCYAFNQPLTIPSGVTSIGSNFMNYCYAFNQPLTIPSGVTSIGSNFMQYCYAFSAIIWNSSVYPTDNSSLSQNTNIKTSSFGAGIIVYGTKRAEFLASLPNRTSSPYRKLINGGY